MAHEKFQPYLPDFDITNNYNKCKYLYEAPSHVPCYYCGEKCEKASRETKWSSNAHINEWSYTCHFHCPLEVVTFCVKHSVNAPNWFFNRIKVNYGRLQLYHHFYDPQCTELKELIRAKEFCWGEHWEVLDELSPNTIDLEPKRLLSILKLYKVFS